MGYHCERLALAERETLLVWLEEHQVAVAEGGGFDFDEDLVGFD